MYSRPPSSGCMPTLSSPSADAPRARRTKRTLFCPDCGRSGRAGDEWDRWVTLRGTELRCPDCGALLTVRPTEDPVTHAPSSPTTRASHTTLGGTRFPRSVALAVTVTAWPCDVHPNPTRARS